MITILIRHPIWLSLLPGLLLVAGCTTGDSDDPNGPVVVATTSIWGDVVEQVTDNHVEVVVPLGVDSHDYQPSPAQVARLARADLVVANGLGLEEGMIDVLEGVARDGTAVLYLAEHLDPIEFGGTGAREETEEDHSLDPHVWFDPLRVADAAALVAASLQEINPEGGYLDRARSLGAELESVHEEIRGLLTDLPRRELVTNHESLGYFAARYGFEVIGVVVPGGSTLGEPSSAELAALVATIVEHDVTAIFAETAQPSRLAATVAAEVGDDVEVVELHTESLTAAGPASTVSGMLVENARLIARWLGN